MKALRLLKPKELSLEEVTSKKLPPGWCRIKTLSVGVCGSDISSISGKLPFTRYPITPGHEFSGIVTEVNQCKSDVAKLLGATHVLTPEELNTNEGIHSNSFSQIIDGVGNESTISSGVKLGKMGAVIVIYGVPGQGEMKIPVLDAFKKDITVKMSRLYPKSFDQAIKLVSDGEINFDPIITHRCSLDDFPKLLDLITTKKIDSIKVIINIGGEKDV